WPVLPSAIAAPRPCGTISTLHSMLGWPSATCAGGHRNRRAVGGLLADPRGFTQRTLTRFIAEEDAIAHAPEDYPEVSIAARGFFALEMLLYDPDFMTYKQGSYTCALVTTIAADLGHQAEGAVICLAGRFRAPLAHAGRNGKHRILSDDEALRALHAGDKRAGIHGPKAARPAAGHV
ncbi:MAG: hypothetical protein U5K36_13370, partial [Roseovarius sp.]|nr:hypothetical protein [Roseovarius sp.]